MLLKLVIAVDELGDDTLGWVGCSNLILEVNLKQFSVRKDVHLMSGVQLK